MFREKYVLDNEMIKPDDQLLASLKIQMKTYTKTHEYINNAATEEPNTNHSSVNLRLLLKYSSFVACFLVLIVSVSYLGLFNGSKSANMVQETTTEDTSEYSRKMDTQEYSLGIPEDSGAASDSSSKIFQKSSEEAKVGMEMAPSSSLIDGKIIISRDTVISILISKNTDGAASQETLTDNTKISDIVNCINELMLTPASDISSIDVSKEYIITIQYNDGMNEENIYLNEQFLKINDSEWFELNNSDSEKLYSLIKE